MEENTADESSKETPSAAETERERPSVTAECGPSGISLHLKSEKSPLARVPKLERKHSSGDLHSRLKTRKMLGVGETDNGDIHRSKISQVLGHNEHLYLKLPRGYWTWQAFLAALLAFQGTFILLVPETASQLGLIGTESNKNIHVPARYYAVTMLAMSYLLWKFLHVKDKGIARTTLIAVIIHFGCLNVVDIANAVWNAKWSLLWDIKGLTMMGVRGVTLLVCLIYLSRLGSATSGLRKSPSHKDVSDHNSVATTRRE